MNRLAVKKLVTVIIATYPGYFRNYTVTDIDNMVNAWERVLNDVEYADADKGLTIFLRSDTKGFPPSPGQVLNCIFKAKPPQHPEALEAWALVSEAISHSIYNSNEEFNALPELVRKVIRYPNQLRQWAVMDVETVQSVVQSNFLRSYTAALNGQSEIDKLPGRMREGLEEKAPQAQLIEKKEQEHTHTEWNEARTQKLEELKEQLKADLSA